MLTCQSYCKKNKTCKFLFSCPQLNVPTWDRHFLKASAFCPEAAGNARYHLVYLFFFYWAILTLAFIICLIIISPGTSFQWKRAVIVCGGLLVWNSISQQALLVFPACCNLFNPPTTPNPGSNGEIRITCEHSKTKV